MGLGIVDNLVINAELVGESLAALVVVVAVDLLEMRVCDLGGILADLDFRFDISLGVLDRDELVNSAENGR